MVWNLSGPASCFKWSWKKEKDALIYQYHKYGEGHIIFVSIIFTNIQCYIKRTWLAWYLYVKGRRIHQRDLLLMRMLHDAHAWWVLFFRFSFRVEGCQIWSGIVLPKSDALSKLVLSISFSRLMYKAWHISGCPCVWARGENRPHDIKMVVATIISFLPLLEMTILLQVHCMQKKSKYSGESFIF